MVAVGVTGHRILTKLEKIEAGVDEAVERIVEAFPQQGLMVVSSLAEGADRLVVGRVLMRPNVRLVVPLPLSKPDYMTDFDSEASKAEFQELLDCAHEVIELPPASTRTEAYEAAGEYVLDHCDVLLAIWDGRAEQGQGGTGAVVANARQRGLPIAWVHAGNRKPGTLQATTLGADQGKLTLERL